MKTIALSCDGESWQATEGDFDGEPMTKAYALELISKFIGDRPLVYVPTRSRGQIYTLDAIDKTLEGFKRASTIVSALELAQEAMNCEGPNEDGPNTCGRLIEPHGDGPYLCPECADKRSGLK